MSLVTVLNMSSAKPRVTLVRGCCAKDASERHAIHETQMRQIAAARLEDKFVFIWLVRVTAIVHKREGTTEPRAEISKYFARCYLPGNTFTSTPPQTNPNAAATGTACRPS